MGIMLQMHGYFHDLASKANMPLEPPNVFEKIVDVPETSNAGIAWKSIKTAVRKPQRSVVVTTD